jgi:hypothetical protein
MTGPVMIMDDIIDDLLDELRPLRFSSPITHVYNPLEYARAPYTDYLSLYGRCPKEVILLGMNPGPWGMAQTGVPFGEIRAVKEWLCIEAPVGTPSRLHPKRPVHGFKCSRSEVSGKRLWGEGNLRDTCPIFLPLFCGKLLSLALPRGKWPEQDTRQAPCSRTGDPLYRLRSSAAPRRPAYGTSLCGRGWPICIRAGSASPVGSSPRHRHHHSSKSRKPQSQPRLGYPSNTRGHKVRDSDLGTENRRNPHPSLQTEPRTSLFQFPLHVD